MQLFAYDNHKNLVSARNAVKQHDYFCLECAAVVRLRAGIHRQAHYYHLTSDKSCRQNGKSMEHLQVQFAIKNLLPEEESFLEYRFPIINRVADVVWLSKKLVFEVQCSFITAQEVKERNRDYETQGFQPVWILHDRRYNQKRRSAAEQFLHEHPHYFTNIDEHGFGTIYDQLALGFKREKLWGPQAIALASCNQVNPEMEIKPSFLQPRIKRNIYFSGDLLSQFLLDPSQFDFIKEEEINPSHNSIKAYLHKTWHFVCRAYGLFFQIILERACK